MGPWINLVLLQEMAIESSLRCSMLWNVTILSQSMLFSHRDGFPMCTIAESFTRHSFHSPTWTYWYCNLTCAVVRKHYCRQRDFPVDGTTELENVTTKCHHLPGRGGLSLSLCWSALQWAWQYVAVCPYINCRNFVETKTISVWKSENW